MPVMTKVMELTMTVQTYIPNMIFKPNYDKKKYQIFTSKQNIWICSE